jgi:phytanoyl-CoA hydroxylase
MANTTIQEQGTQLLSADQIAQYEAEGYCVVPDLFAPDEVAAMLDECESILRGDFGELYDGAVQQDPGSTEQRKAERKISAGVERSVVFRQFLLKAALLGRVQELLGPDLLLFRDILMLKPAKVGSKMPWHQDSNYWAIEPAELCSVWTALDEATVENGCMRVVPGSHKLNLIQGRGEGGHGALDDDQLDLSRAIDVPMSPGSSLFFHSRLLHGSEANHSDKSRRAFITSFMSAQSRLVHDRPLHRSRFFLVSGNTYPGCVRD